MILDLMLPESGDGLVLCRRTGCTRKLRDPDHYADRMGDEVDRNHRS